MMKYILFTFAILFLAFFAVPKALATQPDFQVIEEGCVLECTDYDWEWQCVKRWYGICVDWDKVKVCREHELVCTEPEVTPTPTPEPEVEIVPSPKPETKGTANTSPPLAPACKPIGWIPTITEIGRVSGKADTIYAKWTPVEDYVHDYVVWYGLSPDNLTWNKVVRGSETTELQGELLIGKHVWLNVRGLHEGCTGLPSETIDP